MKAELLRPTSAHVSRIEDLLLRRSKHASRVQRCLCKRLLQQKATRRIAIAGSDREKIQNKAKQAACTVLPTTALGCSCRCTKADFQLQSVRAHTFSLPITTRNASTTDTQVTSTRLQHEMRPNCTSVSLGGPPNMVPLPTRRSDAIRRPLVR